MINKTYPRVCANCRWAVLMEFEIQGVDFGVRCHRYPNYFPKEEHGWCGEFAAANNRPTRYDLPYPSYQEVDNA